MHYNLFSTIQIYYKNIKKKKNNVTICILKSIIIFYPLIDVDAI